MHSGTGDDDADKESESPSKKAKGKPGRKPGQTNKSTTKKDHQQEDDHETGTDTRRCLVSPVRSAVAGTGDDADDADMPEASTTRKTKGRPGRKPGQKNGQHQDESEPHTGNVREESDIRTDS